MLDTIKCFMYIAHCSLHLQVLKLVICIQAVLCPEELWYISLRTLLIFCRIYFLTHIIMTLYSIKYIHIYIYIDFHNRDVSLKNYTNNTYLQKLLRIAQSAVVYRRGGGWGVQTPPQNSEVFTKSNRIANWAENV
jgi:hypothetical protein